MTYYIFVENGKINGCGECQRIDEDSYSAEVSQEVYEDFRTDHLKYIAQEKEVEVEIPDFETVIEEYEDENGETQTREVQQQTGTHTETQIVYEIVLNPNYEQEQSEKRETDFNKAFFNTSLGYVRRSVTMADGSHKDFLSDLLPVISMGVQSGMPVNILTYDKPPFDHDIEDWTEYQHQVIVTTQFIQECFLQLSADFAPINSEGENEN